MISNPLQFQTEQQARSQLVLPKPIPITPLETTASIIYTADPVADFLIEHLWATNVTSGSLTYTLHIVPPSGSPSLANRIVSAKSLGANTSELVTVAINHRIPPSHTLRALCSSSGGINLGGWGSDYFGAYA